LYNYTNILHQRSTIRITELFSTATHILNDNITLLVNEHNIIVPNINLLNEVYNKDFYYSWLMVGFVNNNDNLSLPISIYNLNFKPLSIFSSFFW